MEVNNLKDIINSVFFTRNEFYKSTTSISKLLNDVFDLYFDILNIIRKNTKKTDDEKYALEVFATAFRRVIGSFVLLESGLPQEAHIILRNALEFMLIGIDISYNSNSLEEWKKTIDNDLKNNTTENWHFTKSKICKRISDNVDDIYPILERDLVLGTGNATGYGICEEWERISNISVHAHSLAQIKELFDNTRGFQLLGRKTVENYKKDFIQFRIFFFNIITILIGIPKYSNLVVRDKNIAKKYSSVKDYTLRIMNSES